MTTCCEPYPPSTHTANCSTVVHAPHPFGQEGDGLTACGVSGPIASSMSEVTCEGPCRPWKPEEAQP